MTPVDPPGKDDGEDGGEDEALGGRGDSEEESFFGGEPFNILPGVKDQISSQVLL